MASARTREFEVLDKYSPEDQQVWKDMMSGWLDDPASTAELMQRIATGVLGDPNASAEDKQTAAELIDNADAGATVRVVDINRDDASFRLRLARLYVKQGDKARARDELEALRRLGDKFSGQPEVESLLKQL